MTQTKPTISTATREEIDEAEVRAELKRMQKELKPKRCSLCLEEFKPTRHWQAFCSAAHRAAYSRARIRLEQRREEEKQTKISGV